MQGQTHPKATKDLPRPLSRKPEVRSAASMWKPQEVGVTRQELREIVIDIIG